MEKLYLAKLGKLYVTNTSSDSVNLKESAEKSNPERRRTEKGDRKAWNL